MRRIRVVIADRHPIVLQGISMSLRRSVILRSWPPAAICKLH